MNYELAKQLKDAELPQEPFWQVDVNAWGGSWYYLFVPEGCAQNVFADPDTYKKGIERGDILIKIPTLAELIEACGEDFGNLEKKEKEFMAWNNIDGDGQVGCLGSTPEEAVARLWLSLKEE